MKTVWKFPLEITDEQVIDVPQGAEPLSVQVQQGTPCLWMLVDPEAPKHRLAIRCAGTGHPVETAPGRFIATTQLGPLVFHFWARAA